MENIKFSSKDEKALKNITDIMEGNVASLCYKYVYKTLSLTSKNITNEQFEDKIIENIKMYGCIQKSISLYDSIKNKNTVKIRKIESSYHDELEEKLIEWICQIYLTLDKNSNENYLLNAFYLSLHDSHIYEICNMIESGKYKGYYDFIDRFVKAKDKSNKNNGN